MVFQDVVGTAPRGADAAGAASDWVLVLGQQAALP